MLRPLLIFIAATLSLAAQPAAAQRGVRVTVTRAADGAWLVDYVFGARSPVWVFARSSDDLAGKPWRPATWTVETPGIRLERIGNYDTLSASAPLRKVRFRMRSYTDTLRADYTPMLAFSDGGLAIFGDHFSMLPVASLDAVRALPADSSETHIDQPETSLTIQDKGHALLLGGKASRDRVRFTSDKLDAYAYSGNTRVTETPAFAGVFDVGLPAWIRSELDDFAPRLMQVYRDRLGPPAQGRPMALVAWEGAAKPGWSFGGSVLPGMVVMQISGQYVLQRSPEILAKIRWFIGHESAHFWMGQTVRYGRRAEAWITEGAADLLAVRALQHLMPDYDARAALQTELDECLKLQGPGEPLATAEERGEHRAFYGCGSMLLLAAESVAHKRDPGADVFTFLRALIEANRTDGKLTAAKWLTHFEQSSGDAALAEEVRTFIERGVADPQTFWSRLFSATGVAFTLEGRRLRLRLS